MITAQQARRGTLQARMHTLASTVARMQTICGCVPNYHQWVKTLDPVLSNQEHRAAMLSNLAGALALEGQCETSVEIFRSALRSARFVGREAVLKTVGNGASAIACFDGGISLIHGLRAIRDAESWLQPPAPNE